MTLTQFKEKLENHKGFYALDFSKDVDCEYYLEDYGGEERMKKNYPVIYKSFLKSKETAAERANREGKDDAAEAASVNTILIQSATKAFLDNNGYKYYTFYNNSNTIYIPPITIYWGCFGKDTVIALAGGGEKKASEIEEGDRLVGYDERELEVASVVTGYDTMIYLIKTDEGETRVSGGHPLMRDGIMARANAIKSGDRLNARDGGFATVESVEIVDYNEKVYNFVFKDMEEGTYIIADGLYSGDLLLQNTKEERPGYVLTADDKKFIAEMAAYMSKINN